MTKASLMVLGNVIRLYCLCEAREVIQFEENRKASVIDRKVHTLLFVGITGRWGKITISTKLTGRRALELRHTSSLAEKKCEKMISLLTIKSKTLAVLMTSPY